ncbi:DUF6732 family protein [Neptunicoccus sediminis]|uniref:DUF6732 family protein n=1 Tax=Neptunicoccus sediminis TaxID=1892596 RepID=UPI000845C85B|nr:DUF6732 family protein [Neptunicoccus sediminis]
MRFSVFLTAILAATGANAHVGHVGEVASHDHWVAAGAIGAAVAIAGWNILKGRKKNKAAEAEKAESDEAPQEA